MEEAYRRVAELVAAERAAPAWSSVLGDFAARVPEDAHLTGFRARGDSLVVDGLAGSASLVFQALEESPALANLRASAPVRRQAPEGSDPMERFTISAVRRSTRSRGEPMNFSPSERRTILRGALVLAPFALYLGAVRPYLAALSDVDRIEVASQALARERAAVNGEAQSRGAAPHGFGGACRRPRFFAGRDDVMASAELAAYLGELADRHKVWMQDATTRPGVTSPAGVRTLRVEIRAESDFEGCSGRPTRSTGSQVGAGRSP